MRFLYGDSTEFDLQIDFLRLLNNFVETSVRTIKFENAILDLKNTIIERKKYNTSIIEDMTGFVMKVETAISEAVASSKEQETLVRYADKSKEFFNKFIEESKTKLSDEIIKEIAQLEKKIKEASEENRKILESFFIYDPIPLIDEKYTIKTTEKGYSAKLKIDCEGGFSSIFHIASSESPFWRNHVRARDFVKDVKIPARLKKPFLKKELIPDIVNINDFIIVDLVLSDKDLEVVFRKRPDIKAEAFRLKMKLEKEFSVEVLETEDNGTEKSIEDIPELKNELNYLRLQELGLKIIEKTKYLYPKKQKLETILLEEKDVFEDNLIFELMQKVAVIFAPTIAEIRKHSPSGEELSLKSEDEHGARHEIYLKKSEIKDKLDEIGDKGRTLSEFLNIII
ncbi:MAG: hypothetical protein C3F06_08625 [Candidatus Methanoperedenaceae archaeon]|nr:MAG: hypothetical protein C3F06_08625 [Candidatus Methanoperedenaceae archaeon]